MDLIPGFLEKYFTAPKVMMGFPGDSVVQNPPAMQEMCFDSSVRKIPWRRKWQTTPVFLPGESHGQRSLAAYSVWSHKRVRHDLVTKQQQQKYVHG